MKKLEHILAALTLISLAIAWIIGWQTSNVDTGDIIRNDYPEVQLTSSADNNIYVSSTGDYFVIGEAKGYGGPLQVLLHLDSIGILKNVKPIAHKETIAFFQKVQAQGFLENFIGYDTRNSNSGLNEIDAISGATFTSNAIFKSVKVATGNFAYFKWQIPNPEEPHNPVTFGLKELTLIILFLFSMVTYDSPFKYKRQLRWASLILSIIILGFMTTTMMSIANINSLLMLYLPDFSIHLVWYILILVLFAPIVLKRKNYYCGSICPFGATQEILAKIGNAKPRIPNQIHKNLIWLPRILAWIFVMLALISNNPGFPNYEIFSAFFTWIGADYQFAIIAVVVILSIFISKPWCNYLCPIRGTTDYVSYWISLKNKL